MPNVLEGRGRGGGGGVGRRSQRLELLSPLFEKINPSPIFFWSVTCPLAPRKCFHPCHPDEPATAIYYLSAVRGFASP